MKRIMAIDAGSKKIGIALSDPLRILANPWGYIEAGDSASVCEKIGKLIEEYSVDTLVVGLPKNMNGTIGAQAEAAQRLADTLQRETGLPVHMVDERLSSWEVEEMLIDAGVSRKKRKKVSDKLAATVILQRYLEEKR